jgi:hypothetical protein
MYGASFGAVIKARSPLRPAPFLGSGHVMSTPQKPLFWKTPRRRPPAGVPLAAQNAAADRSSRAAALAATDSAGFA